eukprot:4044948-Prymnesium_polylepis.1
MRAATDRFAAATIRRLSTSAAADEHAAAEARPLPTPGSSAKRSTRRCSSSRAALISGRACGPGSRSSSVARLPDIWRRKHVPPMNVFLADGRWPMADVVARG